MRTNANKKSILNAYYLRAHMYTMVPRQIVEDLQWMVDIGTDAVSLAILEQDLTAAVHNIDFICRQAEKLNMDVFAVPCRWAGLVAGAPKVPSVFTCQNPQTWILDEEGRPVNTEVSGRISSIHYPETFDFMCRTAEKVLKTWNIQGIIWDEPKSFIPDYSPKAVENLGDCPEFIQQVQANVDFYSRLNGFIKANFPNVSTHMFLYASMDDAIIDRCAQIENLDYFGCDGRPWAVSEGGVLERSGKALLGQTGGERFLSAARAYGKKSLWLIENHNLHNSDIPRLEKGLLRVLQKDVDHLIYYYYPRNLQEPDRIMGIIRDKLKNAHSMEPG